MSYRDAITSIIFFQNPVQEWLMKTKTLLCIIYKKW